MKIGEIICLGEGGWDPGLSPGSDPTCNREKTIFKIVKEIRIIYYKKKLINITYTVYYVKIRIERRKKATKFGVTVSKYLTRNNAMSRECLKKL